MKKTLVVYGSTTGTCEAIAQKIASKLGAEVINVTSMTADKLAENDNLLLGTSTWGAGDLQDDWYDGVKVLKSANLSGKTVALFGCGDSAGFSDTFCAAMIDIYEAVKTAGANIVGMVGTNDYSFSDSAAVVDGKFVGLALDDTNESDRTNDRIDTWIAQITPLL